MSIDIHLFSKSPADIDGFGLRRMTGGSPGKGALGISIYAWETKSIRKKNNTQTAHTTQEAARHANKVSQLFY